MKRARRPDGCHGGTTGPSGRLVPTQRGGPSRRASSRATKPQSKGVMKRAQPRHESEEGSPEGAHGEALAAKRGGAKEDEGRDGQEDEDDRLVHPPAEPGEEPESETARRAVQEGTRPGQGAGRQEKEHRRERERHLRSPRHGREADEKRRADRHPESGGRGDRPPEEPREPEEVEADAEGDFAHAGEAQRDRSALRSEAGRVQHRPANRRGEGGRQGAHVVLAPEEDVEALPVVDLLGHQAENRGVAVPAAHGGFVRQEREPHEDECGEDRRDRRRARERRLAVRSSRLHVPRRPSISRVPSCARTNAHSNAASCR